MPALTVKIEADAGKLLKEQSERLHTALLKGMDTALIGLQADILGKLHGDVLRQVSGNLARNIIILPVEDSGEVVTGTVGVGSSAWYGKIHEFGGSFIGHHTLSNPPHLVTRAGGERVMTGSPYGMHFPERSFLRSTLKEDTDNNRIKSWIEGSIRDSWGK